MYLLYIRILTSQNNTHMKKGNNIYKYKQKVKIFILVRTKFSMVLPHKSRTPVVKNSSAYLSVVNVCFSKSKKNKTL